MLATAPACALPIAAAPDDGWTAEPDRPAAWSEPSEDPNPWTLVE